VAVDVDAKARTIVPEHARLNGIPEDQYRVVVGDAVNDRLSHARSAPPLLILLQQHRRRCHLP
jgi:hypothetical protein